MSKVQILQKLVNTKIDGAKSKKFLGTIVRKEFDKEKDEDRAFQLLLIAFKFNLPQFQEMIDDYQIADFKWFKDVKIAVTALLLFSNVMFSQNRITATIGGDIKNCLVGSAPTDNKPKADLLFKLTIQNDRMMEIGIGTEVFPSIDYNKVFVTVGRRIDLLNNLSITGSIEPSVIDRTNDWGGGLSKSDPKMFFTAGASATLRYKPIDDIFFELQGNLTHRMDLKSQFNEPHPLKPSVYFSIGIDLSKKVRKWH